MIIDEIYSAALQGNHVQLETLLSRRQVNLSQLYDAGTSGGVRTRLPFLFFVLRAMSQRRIDPHAIALLAAYGADVNGYAVMESGGAVARTPLLAHAMLEWNSPELTDCLLQNGADPNAAQEIRYPSGGQTLQPLLCLSLQHPDAVYAELLLRNGADPNLQADVYYPNAGFAQQLPPLYYALIEQRSELKLRLLAAYGASAHFPISLGERVEDRVPFRRYVQTAYPQFVPALNAAFPGTASVSMPAVQTPAQQQAQAPNASADDDAPEYDDTYDEPDHGSKEAASSEKTAKKPSASKAALSLNGLTASFKGRIPAKKNASAAPAKESEQKKAAGSPVQPAPNRRCYGKFIAYLFGNFAVLTLAFMIIAPLCFIGTDREMALIGFVIGLPCLAICALIWWRVSKKAQRYGQTNVMGRFVLDSLLMFVKVLLMMLVVTIPLVKAIGDNTQWEERTTSTGRSVFVKKTGDDEYEDAMGARYSSR